MFKLVYKSTLRATKREDVSLLTMIELKPNRTIPTEKMFSGLLQERDSIEGAESVCNICPLKQSLYEIRHDRKKFSCKLNRMLLNHHASSLSPLYDIYIVLYGQNQNLSSS